MKEFLSIYRCSSHASIKASLNPWLSFLGIVDRVLTQYSDSVTYFTSRDDLEKVGRVRRAIEWLNHPQTKQLNLLFLNFILFAMNDFNKLFQADEMCISYLLPEITTPTE